MRIAIILTGEIRTFDQTYQVIYDHLIEPNQADVFIYYQNKSYNEPTNQPTDKPFDFSRYWSKCIKQSHCMNAQDQAEFVQLRDWLLKFKPGISEQVFQRRGVNRNYMVQSGSLIEWYQIEKAGKMVLRHEHEHGFQYDLIIRSRLDTILTSPLNLQAFCSNCPTHVLEDCINDLNNDGTMSLVERLNHKLVQYIQAMGCPTIIHGLEEQHVEHDSQHTSQTLKQYLVNLDEFKQVVNSLLTNTSNLNSSCWSNLLSRLQSIVWAIRANVVWICWRPAFLQLHSLIYCYGDYDDGTPSCWDSESMFRNHVRFHHLIHVDYHHWREEKTFVSKQHNQTVLKDRQINRQHEFYPHLVFAIIRPNNYAGFAQ